MPVHNWTRVPPPVFHGFHIAWIQALTGALNNGVLPASCHAVVEGSGVPPVGLGDYEAFGEADAPTVRFVARQPPRVHFTMATSGTEGYARCRSHIAVRESDEDGLLALIDVLVPGHKDSRHAWRQLIDKAVGCLARDLPLLLLDVLPPGRFDHQGIHGAVWAEVTENAFTLPAGKPLTLLAYSPGSVTTAYVETVGVGDVLPDMPLFLGPEAYVSVPLEATYREAYRSTPEYWRQRLEAHDAPSA
jgi:hypothetical protein